MDSPIYIKMTEAISANPVPMAGSEMYVAMQNGVVDGHENTIPNILQDKTYEVQNWIVMDEHIPSMSLSLIHIFPKNYRRRNYIDESNWHCTADR